MSVTLDRETHQYFEDGHLFRGPSVTAALSQAGLADFRFVDEDRRQRAMERGTNVHWMTVLEDQGILDYRRLSKSMRGYRQAYRDWKKASGFVPEMIEYSFVCDRLGYAGTIDRVGYFPTPTGNRLSAVVDYKTGTGVQGWTRYQLALYGQAVRIFRRIAVNLREDGQYRVEEFSMSTWNQDFSKAMEAVRRWKPE